MIKLEFLKRHIEWQNIYDLFKSIDIFDTNAWNRVLYGLPVSKINITFRKIMFFTQKVVEMMGFIEGFICGKFNV